MLDYPVLVMATPGGYEVDFTFLERNWVSGIVGLLNAQSPYAAAIVFLQRCDELTVKQQNTLNSLIRCHVPVLIIDTTGQGSRRWTDLSARNARVKYSVAPDEAWYDVCFHFLSSLKQSLQIGDFRLLSTSLTERRQKRAPASA